MRCGAADDRSAIEAARKWARLAEFPDSAANVNVFVTGSMFTREFRIEFDAPLSDIERWLSDSPGTSDVEPDQSGSIRIYSIEPGGGAVFAEVLVDEQSSTVRIHTFWS